MLVYIKPLSTFPKLHSDTIFGALTSAISELYPDIVDDMVDKFENNNPPFLLSSAFPVIYNEDSKIKFYPKVIAHNNFDGIDLNILKDYKKVSYIEEKLFFDLLSESILEKDILKDYGNYQRVSNLLMPKEINVDFGFSEIILPNNHVNRLTYETEIFYTQGDTYRNSGLFFLVDFNDESYVKIVSSAIKFLRDRGFGGNISSGKGQFDYEIEEHDEKSEGDSFITLSRFIPTENDLKHINNSSYYEIGSKRGRNKFGEIKKQVRFFKEGSVFPNYQELYGQIVKSGDKSVDYGYAYILKYNSGGA